MLGISLAPYFCMKRTWTRKRQDALLDTVWYVLANRTNTVFYEESKDEPFHFVGRLQNKRGKKPEIDLVSDRPGRMASSASGSIRSACGPRLTQHERAAQKFAHKIAHDLDQARMKKRFGKIVLIAEPHFLGLLRNYLNSPTRSLVRHEVRHEYAKGSDEQIYEQILRHIRLSQPESEKEVSIRRQAIKQPFPLNITD